MPLVAIAGAVAGASALAAGGLTVWGTISAIGGIIGGIGAITGNETMMKIGGIAGLAGGVGAFATGQGWLAGGEAAANAGAEGGNIQAALQAPAPGLENVNPTDMRLAAGTQTTPGGLFDAGSTANLDSGISQSIAQSNSLATEPSSLIGSAAPTAPMTPTTPTTPVAAAVQPGASEGGIFGSLKKFSTFMNQNKELTSLAGNFIGGMFDEQKKQTAELLKARAETERQQLINGSAIPNMNLKLKPSTVFRPGAPTYNPPRTGLFDAR
jgi:hypothetical protein